MWQDGRVCALTVPGVGLTAGSSGVAKRRGGRISWCVGQMGRVHDERAGEHLQFVASVVYRVRGVPRAKLAGISGDHGVSAGKLEEVERCEEVGERS